MVCVIALSTDDGTDYNSELAFEGGSVAPGVGNMSLGRGFVHQQQQQQQWHHTGTTCSFMLPFSRFRNNRLVAVQLCVNY